MLPFGQWRPNGRYGRGGLSHRQLRSLTFACKRLRLYRPPGGCDGETPSCRLRRLCGALTGAMGGGRAVYPLAALADRQLRSLTASCAR